MVRKTIIFLCLISAYLLQVGHDVIPHHHDHDLVAVEHHHDQHDESHSSDSDEHDGLPHFFAHFIHTPYKISYSTEFEFAQKISLATAFAVTCDPVLLPLPGTVTDSPHPPNYDIPIRSALLSYILPERAPPAC
jgi:hypothetical protein